MRARSNILHIYTNFTNMIYTQFNKCIKVFQSDGAHEYISLSIETILKTYVTHSQQSYPHTPKQNGLVE